MTPRSRFGDFLITVAGTRPDLVPEQSLRNRYMMGGALLLITPTMAAIAMAIDLHLIGIPMYLLPVWVPLFAAMVYVLDRWIFSTPNLTDAWSEKAKILLIRGFTAMVLAIFSVHGFLLLAVDDELSAELNSRDGAKAAAIEQRLHTSSAEALEIDANNKAIEAANTSTAEIEQDISEKNKAVENNVGCVGNTGRARDGDHCGYAGRALKLEAEAERFTNSHASTLATNAQTVTTKLADNARLTTELQDRIKRETSPYTDPPGLGEKTQLLFTGMTQDPVEHAGWWLFFLVLLSIDTAVLLMKVSSAPTRIDFEERATLMRHRRLAETRAESPEYDHYINETVLLWAKEELEQERAHVAAARAAREAVDRARSAPIDTAPSAQGSTAPNAAVGSRKPTVGGNGPNKSSARRIVLRRPAVIAIAVAVLGTSTVIAVDHARRDPSPSAPSEVGPGTLKKVGKPVTVPVSPTMVTDVVIPGVGTLRGRPGIFTDEGTMTVQPMSADLPEDLGVTPAGTGFDVSFDNTALRGKLRLASTAGSTRPQGAAPVFAHRQHDGRWEVVPARLSGDRIRMSTSSFSLQVPGWVDLSVWEGMKNKIASGIGGRTAPIACKNNAPGWFSLNPVHSDMVHICSISNRLSNGTEVGEVQIKSNRGATLEVSVPGVPSYVRVERQDWHDRAILGQRLGYDSDKLVLLPAGDTMWVGYTRTSNTQNLNFKVTSSSNLSTADTAIRFVLDLLIGDISKAPQWVVSYSLLKCATGLSIGAGTYKFGLEPMEKILSCLGSQVAAALEDTDTAVKAADSVTSDESTDDKQIAKLVKHGSALKKLGLIVKFWPVIQFAGTGWLDKLNSGFSGGANDVVRATILANRSASGPGGNSGGNSAGGAPPKGGGTGPTGPLAFSVTGSCTISGGTLTSVSGNFTPDSHYSIAAWKPDGSPYPLGPLAGGTVASNGTIRWKWPCAGDPSGTYTTQVTDDASGRTTAKVTFTIANAGQPSQTPGPSSPTPQTTWAETVGGITNTWTNPANAGGTAGPQIPKGTTVQVSCRLEGMKVANGNTWWYAVASPGWDNRFYASADAFYNNGATSGSLVGTPYFDPAVPTC